MSMLNSHFKKSSETLAFASSTTLQRIVPLRRVRMLEAGKTSKEWVQMKDQIAECEPTVESLTSPCDI